MSFWGKLFGRKENKENLGKTNSQFDAYRLELHELGLRTIEDLERIVKLTIRPTTRIEVQNASKPPENSQLTSQFGGQPYFENGENWPTTKSGKCLDFIFQVFNQPELEIPANIKLIQFYYDWDEFPWETEDDGWVVKVYKTLNQEKITLIEKPEKKEKPKYCEIIFKTTKTLPDWEGIDVYSNNASNLSCVLNEDEPWDSYDQVVTKLIGEQDYQSQLGGYPNWVQGESTPNDKNGNPMKLLFQIDSEDNAGLMWGDIGLIYVFYNEQEDRLAFTLQCH